MTSEVLARLIPPPFEVLVDCGGEEHPVTVVDGVPHARAHGVEERVLETFGGNPPACMAAADAVRGAPQQLATFERVLVERKQEPRLAGFSGYVSIRLRATASHFGEPPVDAERVALPLRRMAMLDVERANAAGAWPPEDHVARLARKWVACIVAEGLRMTGLTLEMGPSPGVYAARPSKVGARLRVASDWFRTVFLFGLEIVDGAFTLGATLPDGSDGVVALTQFEREGGLVPRGVERTKTWREVAPHVTLLGERAPVVSS